MSTAADKDPDIDVGRHALPDVAQPLGFLPSRSFWDDPQNVRLATVPVLIGLWVAFMVIFVIFDLLTTPAWTVALGFTAFMAAVVLVHGLFERFIRKAAKRRAMLREGMDAERDW